jgi:hypothetical protein
MGSGKPYSFHLSTEPCSVCEGSADKGTASALFAMRGTVPRPQGSPSISRRCIVSQTAARNLTYYAIPARLTHQHSQANNVRLAAEPLHLTPI